MASEGFFGRKVKAAAAMVVPHVIFSSIWRERNQGVFDGVETLFGHLKDNFVKTIYFWDNGKICSSFFDVAESVDSLYLSLIHI